MKKLFLFTILASLLVPVSGRAQLLENRLRLNSLTLTIGSGLNAIQLQTGSRLDLGSGANDYLYSDGSYVYTPTLFGASTFFATVTTPGFVSLYGANGTKFCPGADTACFTSNGTVITATYLTGTDYYVQTINAVNSTSTNAIRWGAKTTLDTCSSTIEGATQRQGGAASSGVRTKLCLCTSDGAATPAYAWQNIATAAVGNATTCP
jgi:hypothetical protein